MTTNTLTNDGYHKLLNDLWLLADAEARAIQRECSKPISEYSQAKAYTSLGQIDGIRAAIELVQTMRANGEI